MKKEISLLSGGQRQRFNCFLSILNDPEILILDELVTGLDLKMQIKLVNFIKSWKEIKKINLLIVSHTRRSWITLWSGSNFKKWWNLSRPKYWCNYKKIW